MEPDPHRLVKFGRGHEWINKRNSKHCCVCGFIVYNVCIIIYTVCIYIYMSVCGMYVVYVSVSDCRICSTMSYSMR